MKKILFITVAVIIVWMFSMGYKKDSNALPPDVSIGMQKNEIHTSGGVVIKIDGAELVLPDGVSEEGFSMKKVESNELTEYYNSTGKDIGAGPSLGWSLEIESKNKIDMPLSLRLNVPKSFLDKLGSKYEPALFYYSIADSSEDTIEYAEPMQITLNREAFSIKADVKSHMFQKISNGEKYLVLLIMGSVEK